MYRGSLSGRKAERMGEALMKLETKIHELAAHSG
jgi:hypothetical protein